ncbi:MAG: hypothetical protein ACREAA_10325 [Candidatus Polarisedimenticolia bacterium]
MLPSRLSRCAAALTAVLLLAACSERRPPGQPSGPDATLSLDQSSFRMVLAVGPGGTIHLSDQAPFQGRLDAGPILRAERSRVEKLQLMLHLGRFYIIGEGFGHLWEVAPVAGTRTASYRSIALPRGSLARARMSRYGAADRTCLRLDAEASPPWFLTADGTFHERCR